MAASAPSLRPSPAVDGFSPEPLRDEACRALRSFIVRRRRSQTGPPSSSSSPPDDDDDDTTVSSSSDGRGNDNNNNNNNNNSDDEKAEVEAAEEEEEDDVVEVCRVLQREAALLYHTERVRGALRQDPFEVLRDDADDDGDGDGDGDVKPPQGRSRKSTEKNGQPSSSGSEQYFRPGRRRRQLLEPWFRKAEVTDFEQVVTRDGYARIEATVRLHWAVLSHRPAPLNGGRRQTQAGRLAASSHHKTEGSDGGSNSNKSRASGAAARGENQFVELRFCYERTASGEDCGPSSTDPLSVPTYVSYQMEYCGCGEDGADIVGPRQRLLWVNVVAPWGSPSPHGAQLIGDDDDEGIGSDLEGDARCGEGEGGTNKGARAPSPEPKRRKRSPSAGGGCNGEGAPFETTSVRNIEDLDVLVTDASVSDVGGDFEATMKDRFAAGVDADVLHEFLQCAGLDDPVLTNDEGAVLYVLLSFPFYELEWDLVGFVLEAAFGPDEEEEDDDEEDDGQHSASSSR